MADETREPESPRLSRRNVLAGGTAAAVGGLFWIGAPSSPNAQGAPLELDVRPTGVSQAELDVIARGLANRPALRAATGLGNARVVSLRAIDPEERGKAAARAVGKSERWRAVMYDYDAQRAMVAEGRLGDPRPERVRPISGQPLPSPQEWADARDRLLAHPEIGPRLAAGHFTAYRPMPPVVVGNDRRRLVTVGLLPVGPDFAAVHEIVAVDPATGGVQRFAAQAPETAIAGTGTFCGAPVDSSQQITGQGTHAGQYAMTVRRDGVEVWRFTAVRPSVSSGLRGSGIELRGVHYRGRKVLDRAHLPILNVKYKSDICGPYRDWQYSEGMLQTEGRGVAPGFKRTTSAPTTIIQSGSDTGNFLGTAVWINGEEITLMAELEAGWYRYISQWTFHTNGTIKPRFGFAGVSNHCICNVHHHHAYWRFDFDIGGADNNFVQQYTDGRWKALSQEARLFRGATSPGRWRVGNRSMRPRYEIRPGPNDGRAMASPDWPFPVGDVWFLRYQDNEIDDGVDRTTGDVTAKLDHFVDGESLDGADVVAWYGAHFTHDEASEEAGGHSHVVGPDLIPVFW